MNKETAVELEEQIRSIKNVRNGHVDLDEEGEVIAIGVFSDGKRNPKEIKRDVEETFRQIAGFRINHNKISIVEHEIEGNLLTGDKRIRFLTTYQVQRSNGIIEGVVQLEHDNQAVTAKVEAHQFEMELEYIIANATVQALTQIIEEYSIRIDSVREVNMGQVDVIIVTLTIIHRTTGAGHIFVGSVVKTKDLLTSVAKATLDALNRRMDQIV